MADRSIGKIFVELDLDSERYTRSQKRLLKDATSVALNIEENFKKLGLKSSQEFDLMRAKIINAYDGIVNHAKVSKDDIIRAEKMKNQKLAELNKQQYGEQTSIIGKLKEHWVASLAAIYAAWKTVSTVVKMVASTIKDITWQASKYETYGIVMRVVGNNAGYTGKQMEEFSKSLQKSGIAMMESRRTLMMMAEAHIDLKKAQQLGRIAQDAAVIGMMNSSQAMEQMIWGIQSANLRVLRTLGINVSFENSYKKMADALNLASNSTERTALNLTELEKVTARTNEVISFGPRIFGVYTAAMETAAKQALSLQRYWDNLKVLAGTIFTPIFSQIILDITSSIIDLNKDLRDNQELMNEYGNRMRLNFMDAEISIVKIVGRINWLKKELGPIWEGISEQFGLGPKEKIEQDIEDVNKLLDEVDQRKKGLFSGEKVYATKEDEDKAKAIQEIYEKEVAVLKERLETQRDSTGVESMLNELLQRRTELIYSMSDSGKKEAADRADAAEKRRLSIAAEMDADEKKKNKDREIQEVNKKAIEEIAKLREEANDKLRQDIQKNSIKAEQVGKSLFEAEKLRIEKTSEMYRSAGYNKILIDQWVKSEMIIAADKMRQYNEKEAAKAEAEAKRSSKKLIDLSKTTADAMEQNMSDIFFDAMTNQLKNLQDYAIAVLKSIARAIADYYAQVARNRIVAAIATSAASDDYNVSDQDYYGPYSSGANMSSTSPNSSSSSMNASKKSGDTYNVNIQAVDSKSFAQMVEDNPQPVVVTVQKAMRNNSSLRTTVRRTA